MIENKIVTLYNELKNQPGFPKSKSDELLIELARITIKNTREINTRNNIPNKNTRPRIRKK